MRWHIPTFRTTAQLICFFCQVKSEGWTVERDKWQTKRESHEFYSELKAMSTWSWLPWHFSSSTVLFLRWVVLPLKIREKRWVKSPVSQNRTQRRMRRWGGRVRERGKRGDISHMWFIYNSMLRLIWAGWQAPGLGPMPPERERKSDPLLRER